MLLHDFPSWHLEHEPPQSISLSSWFFIRSEQVSSLHFAISPGINLQFPISSHSFCSQTLNNPLPQSLHRIALGVRQGALQHLLVSEAANSLSGQYSDSEQINPFCR